MLSNTLINWMFVEWKEERESRVLWDHNELPASQKEPSTSREWDPSSTGILHRNERAVMGDGKAFCQCTGKISVGDSKVSVNAWVRFSWFFWITTKLLVNAQDFTWWQQREFTGWWQSFSHYMGKILLGEQQSFQLMHGYDFHAFTGSRQSFWSMHRYSTNNYIYDTSCHVNYKGHLLHVKLSKLFI